jgi:hypothetical protein
VGVEGERVLFEGLEVASAGGLSRMGVRRHWVEDIIVVIWVVVEVLGVWGVAVMVCKGDKGWRGN